VTRISDYILRIAKRAEQQRRSKAMIAGNSFEVAPPIAYSNLMNAQLAMGTLLHS